MPTELIKARPPAAAIPVRNRVGIVQKMARAAVIPSSATDTQASETQKFLEQNRQKQAQLPRVRHASVRLPIFRPLLIDVGGPDDHSHRGQHVACGGHKAHLAGSKGDPPE